MGRLDKRTSIVTGAARGLGYAIAERFASEGSAVLINDIDSKILQQACERLKNIGGSCYSFTGDITDPETARGMARFILEKEGRIDILVNNAGITRDSFFHKMEDSDWHRVIDVNLKGAYNCTRAVITQMRDNNYGRIINMSSIVGISGNMGQANYAASKAAVIGFTKTLALESASKNITVNAIAPGFIDTDMLGSIPDKVKEKILDRIPSGRWGRPEEVAGLAAYLASEEAAYITGQVISINGGYLT